MAAQLVALLALALAGAPALVPACRETLGPSPERAGRSPDQGSPWRPGAPLPLPALRRYPPCTPARRRARADPKPAAVPCRPFVQLARAPKRPA